MKVKRNSLLERIISRLNKISTSDKFEESPLMAFIATFFMTWVVGIFIAVMIILPLLEKLFYKNYGESYMFYIVLGLAVVISFLFYDKIDLSPNSVKNRSNSSSKEGKIDENYEYANLEISEELKTSVHQYLLFFKDYIRISKKKNVNFTIIQTDSGLKVKFERGSEDFNENLKDWLKEYMSFVKGNIDDIVINVKKDVTKEEADILRIKLENQVDSLKRDIKIVELENEWLKKNKDFLQNLALEFSKKDNVVHNQYIHDGNQQFANKIQNKE